VATVLGIKINKGSRHGFYNLSESPVAAFGEAGKGAGYPGQRDVHGVRDGGVPGGTGTGHLRGTAGRP